MTNVGTVSDLNHRIAELAKGDAGHVILAFAIIDQLVETLLLAYLPKKLSDGEAELVFAQRGPLGPFPAKIKFAYALGVIDRHTSRAYRRCVTPSPILAASCVSAALRWPRSLSA